MLCDVLVVIVFDEFVWLLLLFWCVDFDGVMCGDVV